MLNDVAIKVENLSKRYRIGLDEQRHDTFGGVITSWIKSPFSNFKRLRQLSKFAEKDDGEDIIWALRDVSFEVKHGEVVGIIGGNGAGKSTLLKIISRITEPTSGRIVLNGRVSSLLEVGTGFHPELTGRENVYLNGAVLGMSKVEIDQKFDEIAAFSEVEKFLDTPVKRYSSGMRVRLAFAVAAHLEPEILLIDEVLAVGDIAFQKKCLGKMGDVAGEGRTVLFISHNMAAISGLCVKVLLIDNGSIIEIGETSQTIAKYVQSCASDKLNDLSQIKDRKGSGEVYFSSLEILDRTEMKQLDVVLSGQDIVFKIGYTNCSKLHLLKRASIGIQIFNSSGSFITALNSLPSQRLFPELPAEGFVYCCVPRIPLMTGRHYIALVLNANGRLMDLVENAVTIDVQTGDYYGTGVQNAYGRQGVFMDQAWWVDQSKT